MFGPRFALRADGMECVKEEEEEESVESEGSEEGERGDGGEGGEVAAGVSVSWADSERNSLGRRQSCGRRRLLPSSSSQPYTKTLHLILGDKFSVY